MLWNFDTGLRGNSPERELLAWLTDDFVVPDSVLSTYHSSLTDPAIDCHSATSIILNNLIMLSALPSSLQTPQVLVPSAVAAYLIFVRILRYRRHNAFAQNFARKHGSADRAALANMTVDDAWPVLRDITELEFPTILSVSVFFALFKVSFEIFLR